MADMPVLERLTHVAPIGGQDQVTRPDLFGARAPYGPLAARPDVLTFVTHPLAQPTTLAGSITVRLFVSTDAPDTDFTAKLVDWYPPSGDYPDGYALNIADGIRRLRFHAGYEAEQRVEPGTVIPLGIEMYPSANVFGVGHRIRLDISSSNFPRFDANPNTGAPLGDARAWRLARNRVYFGPDAPSALTLTLVEA
jgi:putative CocE/NonD family hydrolase